MKQLSMLFVLFAGLVMSCNQSQAKFDSKSTLADSVSYVIGRLEAKNIPLQIEGFNFDYFKAGINAQIAKDSSFKMSDSESQALIQKYLAILQTDNLKKEKEKGEKFLAENKVKEGVVTTPTALQYKVISEGTGITPTANDTVIVHYKGTTIDGIVFDSSYDRGEPAEFPTSGVIPGWVEGLQLMKEGGKYQLVIPSELAYGANGAGQAIKPNSVLIFEMELIKVKRSKNK